MNSVIKLGLTLIAIVLATGCAGNQAARVYYMAVQTSAQAKAQADTARYAALAKMAQGGGESSVAATMAIALTQPTTITPNYIEDSTLKWAQVLTPGITTLGMGLVQAGVAKNASNNAAQVQMASMASNEAIQLGQQTMVSTMNGQWADGANASSEALTTLGVAGFEALNTAGGQTVSVATAGFDSATTIATAGFDATVVGMDNLNEMGQYGMTTVGAVGTAGMQNLTDLGKWGMEGIWLTAENGMNGMEALGTAGMTNLVTVSSQGFTDLTTLGTQGMTNLTTLGTTSMGLVDSQGTNFASIIADMQNTIDQLGGELADPITCSPNADGLYICQ